MNVIEVSVQDSIGLKSDASLVLLLWIDIELACSHNRHVIIEKRNGKSTIYFGISI
jgi:hypothetical protein